MTYEHGTMYLARISSKQAEHIAKNVEMVSSAGGQNSTVYGATLCTYALVSDARVNTEAWVETLLSNHQIPQMKDHGYLLINQKTCIDACNYDLLVDICLVQGMQVQEMPQ